MSHASPEASATTTHAHERLAALSGEIGLEKLDRYQGLLARLELGQVDPLVARLERAQSWDEIAALAGGGSADDARDAVAEALRRLADAAGADFEDLARAVAERSPIDWPAALEQARDDGEREILQQLRIVDEIADTCWRRWSSPSRLGDFEILRELGRGGMGVVYEARQISLNRRVALKVLPPSLGLDGQATKRFEREARAAAQLHHPNIVPVHATGNHEGHHFYAMDLVEGRSLDRILDDLSGGPSGPLASAPGGREWFDTAARLVAEVAEALQYAHDRGIIHRDIKPANLLLSNEGRLCVTDFGLARVKEEPRTTVSGTLLGTPAYMSPEQIAAGRLEVDHRTDVYSLGAVLYELLTLQRPFPGNSHEEVLSAVLTREPRAPRRINARIPVDLQAICLKALEKRPQRRYASAGEMAQDLRRYRQGTLIRARRAGFVRRSVASIRRHPTTTAAAAVAGAFVLIILGLSWSFAVRHAAESRERAMARARLALTEGEYREALTHVDEALAIAPERSDARIIRARLLTHLDRPGEAYEEARRALRADPEDWKAHLVLAGLARGGWDARSNLATIAFEEHIAFVERRAPETADAYYLRSLAADSPGEALQLLDRGLRLDPVHVDSVLARIRRLEEIKDIPAATAECERLLLLRPRSLEVRRVRAWLYRASGDWLGALAEMDRAVELDPGDPSNRDHRARAYRQLGRVDQAIEEITRAIELAPGRASYYALRAECFNRSGRFDEAARDAEEALKLEPDQPRVHKALVDTYYQSGREDRALRALAEYSSAARTWIDQHARCLAHCDSSLLYVKLGRAAEALTEANLAVEADPAEPRAITARVRALDALGDDTGRAEDCQRLFRIASAPIGSSRARLSAALGLQECDAPDRWLDAFDSLVRDYPRWYLGYLNRVAIHVMLGHAQAALEDSDMTIALAPNCANGYGNRALVYGMLGRYEEELADTRRALELNPYDETYRVNYATQLMRFGRQAEALEQCEQAIRLFPRELQAHMLLASLLALRGECGEVAEILDEARSMRWPVDVPGVSVESELSAAMVDLAYACPDVVDRSEMLRFATAAFEQAPYRKARKSVLGQALLHHARYERARDLLVEVVESGGEPWNGEWFLLAVAASRLGDTRQARAWFDRGAAWMDRHFPEAPYLRLKREEAARLLGIVDERRGEG